MTADAVESDREFVMLLTPEAQLRHRISPSAFSHYYEAVKREVVEFFELYPQPAGFDLQVDLALFPDRDPLIDIQSLPVLSLSTSELLLSRLVAIEQPALWNGPAAFSFRTIMAGGWVEGAAPFAFPFCRLCPPYPEGEAVDSFLERCATQQLKLKSNAWTAAFKCCVEKLADWLPLKWSARIPLAWRRAKHTRPPEENLPALPAEPDEEVDIPDLSPIPLDQIEQLIAAFPEEVRHYWRRIQATIDGNDQAAVTRDCRQALRLVPDHPWTTLMLVYSLRSQDESATALGLLSGLIQTHPRLVDGYLLRAEIYAEIGAYDAMFADLEHALTLSPRSPGLLMRHARACSALGRIEDAYRDLAILQRLDPHDSRIFALRAYIRRRSSGDPEAEEDNRARALADVERALKLDANCSAAYGIRAEIRISAGQMVEAIEDCDRALQCDPGHVDAFAFRGLARFRLKEFSAAAADLTAALEKGCLLQFVRPLLADAQDLQGDHEAAIATLDAVLEQTPDDPVSSMHKAALLLSTDRAPEALELLNQLLEKQPELALAHAERGKVHRMLLEFDDALEDFSNALRLGANDPLIRLNRALTLLDLKRYSEALNEFDAGLKEFPDSALGHFYRGCTCRALQRDDEALAEFSTTIRLEPDFADAYFQRASMLMSRQEFAAAIDDFTQLVQRVADAKSYIFRGQARILAGQLESADEDFQEAIHLSPGETEHFRIVQMLTECEYHHRREDYEASVERATEVLAMDDQCVPAWLQRAASRWYGNQFVEAIEDYTQVIEITEPNAGALNGRGQIYAELGEYELALADLDQAVELCDADEDELLAYLQNGRGLALTGLERYDEAAAAFEQSLIRRPGNAWMHYNQGLMYLAQGQPQSAIPCFQLALRLTEPPLRACQRARALVFLNRQEALAPTSSQ